MADLALTKEQWVDLLKEKCEIPHANLDAYAELLAKWKLVDLNELFDKNTSYDALKALRESGLQWLQLANMMAIQRNVADALDVAKDMEKLRAGRIKLQDGRCRDAAANAFEKCKKFMWYCTVTEVSRLISVFKEGNTKACVTTIDNRHAATAFHCLPDNIQRGTQFPIYRDCDGHTEKKMVRVKLFNKLSDFVVLELADGKDVFDDFPPSLVQAKEGDSFVILGYPAGEGGIQMKLSVFPGWVNQTRMETQRNNFIVGVYGTVEGCSGGGVFRYDGALLGICVEGKSPPDFYSHKKFLTELFRKTGSEPAHTLIVPASLLDTMAQSNDDGDNMRQLTKMFDDLLDDLPTSHALGHVENVNDDGASHASSQIFSQEVQNLKKSAQARAAKKIEQAMELISKRKIAEGVRVFRKVFSSEFITPSAELHLQFSELLLKNTENYDEALKHAKKAIDRLSVSEGSTHDIQQSSLLANAHIQYAVILKMMKKPPVLLST